MKRAVSTVKVYFADVGRRHLSFEADVPVAPGTASVPDLEDVAAIARTKGRLMSQDVWACQQGERSGLIHAGMHTVGAWTTDGPDVLSIEVPS